MERPELEAVRCLRAPAAGLPELEAARCLPAPAAELSELEAARCLPAPAAGLPELEAAHCLPAPAVGVQARWKAGSSSPATRDDTLPRRACPVVVALVERPSSAVKGVTERSTAGSGPRGESEGDVRRGNSAGAAR